MAKPAFDPSQPFEQVAQAKPAFDPSQPFETDAPSTTAQTLDVGDTMLHKGLHGLTQGFSDELGGAGTALIQAGVNNLPDSWADKLGLVKADPTEAYRFSRDTERANLDDMSKRHGALSAVSEFAGGLAPALAGGAALKGLKGAVALGTIGGLGNSDADLTTGDASNYGRAALSAGAGGLLGAAAHGIGQGISAAVGRASGAVRGGLRDAEDRLADQLREAQEAEIASMRGELGAAVQKGNRLNENVDRLAPNIPANLQMRMAQLEQRGVLPELRERLARANLSDLPGQKAEIDALDQALKEKMANAPAELQARFQGQLQAGPKMLLRSGPAAAMGAMKTALVTGTGGVIGGTLGSAFGPVGAAVGAMLGSSAANATAGVLKNPAAQVAAFQGVDAVMQAAVRSGRYAQPFLEAATRGPQAVAALDFVMSQRDPGWRAIKERPDGEEQ